MNDSASCTIKYFYCGHTATDKNDFFWKSRHLSGTTYNKLYYIVSGSSVFSLNGRKYTMKPGYLYFIPKYTLQSFVITSEALDHYWLHFDIEPSYLSEDIPVCVKCDRDKVISLFESITELEARPEENVFKRSMRILDLYEYYLSCAKENKAIDIIAADKRQTEIVNFIKENFKRKISTEELSDLVGLSVGSLSRYFKKAFGSTPIEFINSYRIDRACLLLTRTSESVLQIAQKCGFEDYRYFSRLFKRRMHMTPLEYRAEKTQR